MDHTYTLSSDGIINPSFLRNCKYRLATVESLRSIEIDGMTLRLIQGEPDLPVGSQVRIWLDRYFHCETLEYTQQKQAEAERKAVARKIREETIKQEAINTYLISIQALISQYPSAPALTAQLESLYADQKIQHKIFKAHWRSHAPDMKQKSIDAYSVAGVIAEAIHCLARYMFDQLNEKGIKGKVAYAYSPKEGATDGFFSPGKDHFQLSGSLVKGRLRRNRGDALCKPAEKFWGLLETGDKQVVTCSICLGHMINLLKIPPPLHK